MICFLTFKKYAHTIKTFKEYTNFDEIVIISYEEIQTYLFKKDDVVIFCDIDRCNDERLQFLKEQYSKVQQIGCFILNNPNKAFRRFDLLTALYELGVNDFQAYRVNTIQNKKIKFPVFLRKEFDHTGSLTELINDSNTLTLLVSEINLENVLILEFIDTSSMGYYHKYGAFILKGKIVPRHFFMSYSWTVKSATTEITESFEKEEKYLNQNPHDEEIQQIAKYANIDYGRIDYAITGKGIQVFEINTNPTIIDKYDIAISGKRHAITKQFINSFSLELKKLALLKNE